MSYTHVRLWPAIVGAAVLGGLAVPAALPAAADPAPNSTCVVEQPTGAPPNSTADPMQVCASFDQAAYQSSGTINLTVTVTDEGTSPGNRVQIIPAAGSSFTPLTNADSGLFSASGADITAGQTVTSSETGYANDPSSGTVVFNAQTEQNFQSDTVGSPVASISATVTPVVGGYGGVIFDDANGNGVQDPGEGGVAGTTVTLSGPFNGLAGQSGPQTYQATTDADGNFLISDLPGGNYTESVTPPQGWQVAAPTSITVDGSAGQTRESLPATPPLSDSLHATMIFDRPSYHVGDPAGLTITLTNVSAKTISNIQDLCDQGGFGGSVLGIGKGWNVFSGAGVTLAPGQRKVFHLSEAVTADSLPDGTFVAGCVFGPNATSVASTGYPTAQAQTKVLAAPRPIDFSVQLVNDGAGGTPQFVSSLLVEAANGDPIDFYGDQDVVQYSGIPQGRYDLTLFDGWQFAPGQSALIDTSTITAGSVVQVHVVPSAG